jgi:hypothetical protein
LPSVFSLQRLRRLCGSVVVLLIGTWVTSCSGSDAASSDPASIREAQLRFVKNYVAAIRSKDTQKVFETFHTAYRGCVSPENKWFFDRDFARMGGDLPSTDYEVVNIKPADPKQAFGAFLPADGFAYPVKPAYVIQVDFETTTAGSFYTLLLEVAPDRGSWYWVGPCPNAKGLEFIQQQIREGERQKAEVRKRIAELKDPLLSELKQLLQAHDKIGAIKKYSKETGADQTTAVLVIRELEPADRH